MNYDQAKRKLATARSPAAGKPIDNNTRLFERADGIAARLHNTDILLFRPDGSVVYNSGGWKTVTTKQRMNEYGPARIWSDRGTWFIAYDGTSGAYADFCEVGNGMIKGILTDAELAEEKRLRKTIGKYAKDYVKRLLAGKIGLPSHGDCWYCLLRATPIETSIPGAKGGAIQHDGTGKPLGEVTENRDHLVGHLGLDPEEPEPYYVPSLAWNALERMGASQADRQALHELQSGRRDSYWGKVCAPHIENNIRRYVLQQLGLAY